MHVLTHRHLRPEKDQRVFFCGDVHGNFTQLKAQLNEIGFVHGADILILVGDVIDRGAENVEMVEYATCTPGVHCVLGNHELAFLSALEDGLSRSTYVSPNMGGAWIDRYSAMELEDLVTLIESCMPAAITIEREDFSIGVIHAAAPDNWIEAQSLTSEDLDYCLWSRDQCSILNRTPVVGVDVVVHGHVCCNNLIVSGNQIWIDTLFRTGKLTIIESKELLKLVQKDCSHE